MPKPCAVCAHIKRAEIDERLARQVVNIAALAREFDVGRRSVERHRDRHLPDFLRAFAGRAQPLDYTAIQAEAERLYLVTLDALGKAESGVLVRIDADGTQHYKQSLSTIARLVKEARSGLDQLAKLAAVGADGNAARTPTTNDALDARIAEALLRVERRQLGAGDGDVVDVEVIEEGASRSEPSDVAARTGVRPPTPGPGAGSGGGGFAYGGGSISSDTPENAPEPTSPERLEAMARLRDADVYPTSSPQPTENGSMANCVQQGGCDECPNGEAACDGPARATQLDREGPAYAADDANSSSRYDETRDLTPERQNEVRYPEWKGNPAASEDERRAEGYGPNPVTTPRPSPKGAV
jgi:hypothetical protein